MIDPALKSLGENLLIAAIGGILTTLFSASIRKYKRFYLERKYPIAGDYLSEYEDEEKGKKFLTKAPVKLTQKGKDIRGVTHFSGRTWILDGEISERGYLFGLYHPESIHDKGAGNFFLEIDKNGDMNGLWSGYDAGNKNIIAHKYSFKRVPKFTIATISQRDVPAVLHLAEHQLGAAYIHVKDLTFGKSVAAFSSTSGKVLGFCTGKKITLQDLYELIPQLKAKKLKQLEAGENLGFIGSIATDPSYSGRGIGSAVIQSCIQGLEAMNINVLVMTGWKTGNGVHIGGIAKNLDFQPVLEIAEFWKNQSIEQGFSCPSCGHPPCLCSAVVYVRHSARTVYAKKLSAVTSNRPQY